MFINNNTINNNNIDFASIYQLNMSACISFSTLQIEIFSCKNIEKDILTDWSIVFMRYELQ